MNKQRPDFVCWHCQRHFGQTLELEHQTQVLVECPYCHSECLVELEPYQTHITEIMRGGKPTNDDPGATKPQYRFPARVPTTKPKPDNAG